MKDVATDSRSLSAERNFQNMLSASLAEIPSPNTVLPVAILERPSLESSENFSDNNREKQVNFRVGGKMDYLSVNDAKRRVALKDPNSRNAARRRLGISSVNSSQMNMSRNSRTATKLPPRPKWNASGRI